MKIMTAMYALKRGGSYDRFMTMLEAFLERKWEVHCLSLTPIQIKNCYYHNHVIRLAFRIRNGFIAKLMVLLFFPLYSFLIGCREKVDLFIAFGSLYAFVQAIPKWILKRPMVTLIRGDSTFGLRMQKLPTPFLWLNKIVEYLGLMFSNHIVTNNVTIQKEIIRKVGRKKQIEVEVLFNNVPRIPVLKREEFFEIRTHFGIPQNAKVLVTAGVINRGKNIEILIRVLPKIEMKNLYLLIIGDGSTRADFRYQVYLRELTKKLGLGEKVNFTGWVEKGEMWKIFYTADLFLLPSKNEGMPNILLEALGCDTPCFGSDVPGICDILHFKELMFDPMDEEALTGKIKRFFSDKEFSERISRLCLERKGGFLFDWKEKTFEMTTRSLFRSI